MLSQTEENYLKAFIQLSIENPNDKIGTNRLAEKLSIKPPTVNDMLKKLKEKKLVNYKRYGPVSLTGVGKKKATEVLRKHRLWETFLYDKLDFTWDEVREVAEQLEHIQSPKLINKIEEMLGYPEFDPHGQPIPSPDGSLRPFGCYTLADVPVKVICKMIAVKENSAAFLQYVTKLGLGLHAKVEVVEKQEFDGSIRISIDKKKHRVSEKFAKHILVVCGDCNHAKSCSKKQCEISC